MSWFAGLADRLTGRSHVELNFSRRAQPMSGFGGSMAYYQNWVTEHPSRDAILDCVFGELRPSIVRLRNAYDLDGCGVHADMRHDAALLAGAAARLGGQAPLVLLAAWSPPARLKASGATTGGQDGTCLARAEGGFVYAAAAQWWREACDKYEELGIDVWAVSLQNEINFSGGHDCCLFDVHEGRDTPGYDKYLTAAREVLRAMKRPPVMVGPEHTAMDCALPDGDMIADVDIIGNHLYGSGKFDQPASLLPAIKNAGAWAQAHRKPLFMTEYSPLRDHAREDPLRLATTIHNCVAEGNCAAYLQWDLFWGAGTGEGTLLVVDNPFDDHAKFSCPKGFRTTPSFYWFAHYSRFVRPGFQRVYAAACAGLLVTAFSGPSANYTIVVINPAKHPIDDVAFRGVPGGARNARVWQSTLDSQGLRDCGDFHDVVKCLPAESITTISTSP